MNMGTRRFVVTSLLVAICLLLGLTPIGYIPIPPIEITLMCIPVIIGVITEGLGVGLVLGFFFGLTSFLQIFIKPTALSQLLFALSPLKTIILVFIPRLLVPVTAWLVHRAIRGESRLRRNVAAGLGALIGSLTNTVLFLGALYLLFLPSIGQLAEAFGSTPELLAGVLAVIGAMNGLPEAAVAVLLCIPIVAAVSKLKRRGSKTTEN
jgi:uncharacterized membrane protein